MEIIRLYYTLYQMPQATEAAGETVSFQTSLSISLPLWRLDRVKWYTSGFL